MPPPPSLASLSLRRYFWTRNRLVLCFAEGLTGLLHGLELLRGQYRNMTGRPRGSFLVRLPRWSPPKSESGTLQFAEMKLTLSPMGLLRSICRSVLPPSKPLFPRLWFQDGMKSGRECPSVSIGMGEFAPPPLNSDASL